MNKMVTFIELVDGLVQLHFHYFHDAESLAVYRDLRTELENEYEVWEIIQENPGELGFILQEKDYAAYMDTFHSDNIPITEEQFYLVKDYFTKTGK